MTPIKILYEVLEKHKDFDISDNTGKFLDTVDKIVKYKDPTSIGVLLKYFDDNTEYSWVFQSISSAIEYYPMQPYVEQLLISLPLLLKNGPIWADSFFNRIFNHPLYLEFFKSSIHLASKEDLLKLFEIMDQESPHHKDLIAELRNELNPCV